MAFDYTRFKTQIGAVIAGLNDTNAYRGGTLSNRVDAWFTAYDGASLAEQALLDNVLTELDSARQANNSWVNYLSTLTEGTIGVQLDRDLPMSDTSLLARITELARRMRRDSETMVECPCTVTPASIGSPTGDHQFVYNRYEGLTGRISDYMIPDVYTILLSADRSHGGTQWAETFSLSGKPADQLPTDAAYPSGTGLLTSLTAIDPADSFGVVTDGTFDDLSGSNFANWTQNGVWNTTVFQGTDDPRDGSSGFCLRLVGNGSLVHKIRQEIDVDANTTYAVHMRLKKVADPSTDWAVSILLTDSAGTALAGPAAYVNTVTSSGATSIASSWANPVTGVFVTPATLPSTGVFLEIRFHQSGSLTTAPVNTAEVLVDHVVVTADAPLYDGGPALTIFSGITEGVLGDGRTATIALTSGAIGDFVIRGLDRLLGLAALPVRLPTTTSGAATIANSVIA